MISIKSYQEEFNSWKSEIINEAKKLNKIEISNILSFINFAKKQSSNRDLFVTDDEILDILKDIKKL